MPLDWNDLRLFLDVARLGGLSAASATSGVSPATLGRRMTALERAIGEALFHRSQTGYRLTPAGEQLFAEAEEVEAAMLALQRWREGAVGERVVRLSAGAGTSAFIASHIGEVWSARDRFALELVTLNEKVDIGRRHADLGIRNQRPTEPWLAGRLIGRVGYALYSAASRPGDPEAGPFVGVTGEGGQTRSARWLQGRHGGRIGVRGNDAASVRELVAAGAGLSVFPCFVGDSDPRLVRASEPIAELQTEQWLVSHHEERHAAAVRTVADRIAALMARHSALFRGERPRAA